MNIFDMKKSDFKSVPRFNWKQGEIKFDSLVIIPTTHKHESGYRCMEYCAIKNGEPLGLFGGGSDVMHLDGIGGYGKYKDKLPTVFNRKPWNIDCLPCGYIHLWCNEYKFVASDCGSDFELYTEKKNG